MSSEGYSQLEENWFRQAITVIVLLAGFCSWILIQVLKDCVLFSVCVCVSVFVHFSSAKVC